MDLSVERTIDSRSLNRSNQELDGDFLESSAIIRKHESPLYFQIVDLADEHLTADLLSASWQPYPFTRD
jgi:hypothetical protein